MGDKHSTMTSYRTICPVRIYKADQLFQAFLSQEIINIEGYEGTICGLRNSSVGFIFVDVYNGTKVKSLCLQIK
jgi:hypothetical protein